MEKNTGFGDRGETINASRAPVENSRRPGRRPSKVTQAEAAEIITSGLALGKDAGLDVRIGDIDGAAVAQFIGWRWEGGKLVKAIDR